jgi:hypothetical protein
VCSARVNCIYWERARRLDGVLRCGGGALALALQSLMRRTLAAACAVQKNLAAMSELNATLRSRIETVRAGQSSVVVAHAHASLAHLHLRVCVRLCVPALRCRWRRQGDGEAHRPQEDVRA